MTVDNLPTQLPKDASEYFGSSLTPILEEYIEKGLDGSKVFSNAAITRDGQVVPEFRSTVQPLLDKLQVKRVLILGAGLVSRPVIEYLSQFPDLQVTVVAPTFSAISEQHQKRFLQTHRVTLLKHEIYENKLGRVDQLIKESDVVVSLLPAVMHPWLFESVLEHKKHLITASYVSEKLKSLHEQIKKSNLTWLNEIGLDPGLDHMSAMKMIDELHSQGRHITSFVSWCGGLPAPENADNPLGYKFSWSPAGVLRALSNSATFLDNGKTINVDGKDLLSTTRPVSLHPAFRFEGYPNRDSLKYIEEYHLDRKHLKTMFRGTLRYGGFAEFMSALQSLGFLDHTPSVKYTSWRSAILDSLQVTMDTPSLNWVDLLQTKFPDWSTTKLETLIMSLHQLDMLNPDQPYTFAATRFDSLCAHLQQRLQYRAHERDMCFLHHTITSTDNHNNDVKKHTATLVMFGGEQDSAMSLTVGLPVAVATRLLLEGRFEGERGVVTPVKKAIYEPVLSELERLGIQFVENHY